jgi:hypothetical protein
LARFIIRWTDLREELGVVINRSLTIFYFEKGWMTMVDRFKLHDNKHINVMYHTRTQWVPTYFQDIFFADMSTTQRSESMNALLKLWLDNHKLIYQFVMQIEKLIEDIWQRESDEDLKTMNETHHTYSYYQFENEACQIYTRNIFSVFKEIIKESSLGFVSEITRDALYQVKITYHPLFKNLKPDSYMIDVDKEKCTITCSCKGFEVEDLFYSHCIKVMQHIGIAHLSTHYILKRWTKSVNTNFKRHVN